MSTPPPPKDNGLKPGVQIGQYKLVKLLGKGGFGEVWKALDQRLRRMVAIKFLLGEHQNDPETRRRFEAEAVLATRITHPSLVQMYGTGESLGGALYHVMEFVDGESLHSRLHPTPETRVKLDLGTSLDIAWQVANVLAPLHGKGIVHRDLKPLNLMLVSEDAMPHGLRVKLLDFGIAKMTDKEAARELDIEQHTTKGAHPGSQAVMAPEQWRTGAEQGPEIDVYALGVICYRMLTGIWLFKDNWRLGHEILDPPLITKEDPSIPVDVAMLVHRMLLKNPAERPTMAAVRDELGIHPSVKNAMAGQVIIKSTMEMNALASKLSSGTAPTADGPAGSSAVDSARAPTGSLDANTSARNGQQVPAPMAISARRRRQRFMAVGLGAATLLLVGTVIVRSVSSPPSHAAAVGPVLATPQAAGSALSTADLGSTVAPPISKPAAAPSDIPDVKTPASEKKRKKNPHGRLIQD